ncbi:hypothetical protein [Kitasatospora sp. NE20-6]|uniref:ATP-binding protein n=1 Tax=Kitasatospora sp. NE20-6 TaxID=2859066 RepID=UPI0038B2674B
MNKTASQVAFNVFNVPSAASIRAGTLDQTRAAVGRIGYPVVVKPAAATGSIGVSLAEGVKDLPTAHAWPPAPPVSGSGPPAGGRLGRGVPRRAGDQR